MIDLTRARTRLAFCATVAALVLGLSACDKQTMDVFTPKDRSGLQDVKVSTSGPVEYGHGMVPAISYLQCSDAEVSLSCEELVDSTVVGPHMVSVAMHKDPFDREVKQIVMVADTERPRIRFKKRHVTIGVGEEFNPADYIDRVWDVVDGELERVAEKPQHTAKNRGVELFWEKGWYRFDGTVDTNTPGTYKVKVIARDRHGNMRIRKLVVKVVEG